MNTNKTRHWIRQWVVTHCPSIANSIVRSFLVGMAFGLGVLTMGIFAVSVTGTIKTWATGDTLTATDLNTAITSLQTAITGIPNWTKNGTSAYYNDGAVGIGTTTPTSGTALTAMGGQINFSNTVASTMGTGNNGVLNYNSNTGLLDIGATAGAATNIAFSTSNSASAVERMRITSAGNVGIGATSPTYSLEIKPTSDLPFGIRNSANTLMYSLAASTVDGAQMSFYDQTGTQKVRISASSGAASFFNNTAGVGIGTTSPNSSLDVQNTSLGDGGQVARFGDDVAAVTVMRFNLGTDADRYGLTLQGPVGTQQYIWSDNSSNLRVMAAGGGTPTSNTSGTVIGTQTSTRETKQDIQKYTASKDLLDKLLKVQLHTFKYKHEAKGYGEKAKRKLGFIADEVDPLFMDEQGRAIDQVSVNGILIGAIQSLKSLFDSEKSASDKKLLALESENTKLREEIAALRTTSLRVAQMEERLKAVESMHMARK